MIMKKAEYEMAPQRSSGSGTLQKICIVKQASEGCGGKKASCLWLDSFGNSWLQVLVTRWG
jgi:hypothetical protein